MTPELNGKEPVVRFDETKQEGAKYTTVERYEILRFAQHDNRSVITGHAERSKAESKHLSPPMPNVHWITVVYLGKVKKLT